MNDKAANSVCVFVFLLLSLFFPYFQQVTVHLERGYWILNMSSVQVYTLLDYYARF